MPITTTSSTAPRFSTTSHCIAVSVADAWPGEAIAGVLKRLIAQMGRPAAYLKDGGSELQKAADLLEEQGLGSACIDDISHVAANMLKRSYQHHPTFERFLAACGRVSGQLKQTLLAGLAPPTVRTKARFMSVHRLFTWADRLLKLSPAGGTKAGSVLARLRESAAMNCRRARASSNASAPMPKACWSARRSQDQGALS